MFGLFVVAVGMILERRRRRRSTPDDVMAIKARFERPACASRLSDFSPGRFSLFQPALSEAIERSSTPICHLRGETCHSHEAGIHGTRPRSCARGVC